MIIGIGCDVTDFKIAKELNWEKDEKFLIRVFSPREIESYKNQNRLSYLTGRFAVKEAVLKCLGTGMHDGISLNNIEILQSEFGKPKIELKGEIRNISQGLGINKWHISISHSTTCSIAYVIAEN
ncbi:holo-ACP synthase [uncultured Kordia sp.]|uniref:holo-ACP synthase n=1 Tax=uncultured Kordia sp. TaxID=507699 RepID=UPI00262F0244|nr:holo-ACP synthase [uncultured Kordia sp.]